VNDKYNKKLEARTAEAMAAGTLAAAIERIKLEGNSIAAH
jgi:hypothetical protein